MELATLYIRLTNEMLNALGMTHPMAHIHAGLIIYVAMQLVLRTRRASGIALQAVFGAEMVNEILDRAFYGSWRWSDTLADIALTMLWPTILYLTAKYRRARWTARDQRKQAEARMLWAQRSRAAQLARAAEAMVLAPERVRND